MKYKELLQELSKMTEEQLNEVVYIKNKWTKESECYGLDLILDLDTFDHD